jgi:hypothetical protein
MTSATAVVVGRRPGATRNSVQNKIPSSIALPTLIQGKPLRRAATGDTARLARPSPGSCPHAAARGRAPSILHPGCPALAEDRRHTAAIIGPVRRRNHGRIARNVTWVRQTDRPRAEARSVVRRLRDRARSLDFWRQTAHYCPAHRACEPHIEGA